MGILADIDSTVREWALWLFLNTSPDAPILAEYIIVTAICLREDSELMADPEVALCVEIMLDAERDPQAAVRAVKGLHERLSSFIARNGPRNIARNVRTTYGISDDVAFVTKGHDHDQTMRELVALHTKLVTAGPKPTTPADLFHVETDIRRAHYMVDAVAQLARDGAIDERALFPEKGLARSHDDVKREIGECSRLYRAQWECGLPKGISKDEKRLAFREYRRKWAAAANRGEAALVVWRQERLAMVRGG
ncbi:uncharacterized protein LOC62_04G006574 [Vanrija pseudolonga]|uniref:Uncharacterized protein n=1 Tax=Vanrija pseudolonga TaxID=143232 RepID=A0AAF0YGI5_9TREE|nr:hypothetical protein LOC62_04G006574 [Vanrija pseudolonga]